MASIASASSSKDDEPPHEPSTRVSSRTGTIAPSVRSQADLFYGLERTPLRPCSPLWVQHWSYKREHIGHNAAQVPLARLRPMELQYSRETDVSEGWESCSHPEGRLYFYRPPDPDQENSRPVLTNSMLFDNENFLRAEVALTRVNEMLQTFTETPEDTLIVVDIRAESDWYYCVSWSMRRIFWPEETDILLSSGSKVDVYDVSHLASRNEALFWTHAITFPKFGGAYAPIPELRNLLNFAYVDTMTSETSTITVDKETLVQFRSVVDQLKIDDQGEHNVWIVARMMAIFCKSRFLNYFGQPEAVLNWGDKVQGQPHIPLQTKFFRTVSPFLFGWPSVYLKDIQEIWVNGNIRFTRGQQFILEMKSDWEESTTPATMLLTANVSLLAIQSIDNTKGDPARSLAQIAAYVSLLLSLANYITCQILLRQHRRIINSYADLYFLGPSEDVGSLEIMAVVFSLPQGLFLWSMLTFLLAICWIFFWQTSSVTRILLGVILSALFFLLSGLSFSPWQPSPDKHLTFSERQEKLAAKIRHGFGRLLTPQRRRNHDFTLETLPRRS